MKRPRRLCVFLLFFVALGAMPGLRPASAAPPAAPPDRTPEQPTPIMPLDEVQIGMKGYGLTVFRGTKIEPFPVEVVSVVARSGPQRSVIWIIVNDERIEHSGPVQGMSGSPIFLWDDGEDQTPGQGGRLIGAFAFGFAEAKDPLVGVQPIEYMREVGDRIQPEAKQPRVAGRPAGRPGLAREATRTFDQLARLADGQRLSPNDRMRLTAAAALFEPLVGDGRVDEPRRATAAAPRGDGEVIPMLLPVSVGSSELAAALRPMLEPMGLVPVGGGDLIAGPPPRGMDVEGVRIEPGSVLAVPLVSGDLDLSAAGTVTDVLPDGTVLAFGHAMFGQGPLELPMASGYVHFIVPRRSISFKMSGSLAVQGSLLQDEVAAIAGTDEQRYRLSPVKVNVEMPGHEIESYNYNVVDHASLTPMLAAVATLRSITAAQDLPLEHTIYLDGELRFTGDHVVKLDTMLAGGGSFGALFEMLPPLATAMQNPHEALKLESVEINARVIPELKTGTIVNARMDQAEVAPGETVGVTVWVRPYGQGPQQFRTELRVPASLPEGDYRMVISDGSTYLSQMMTSRPHLFTTTSVDELMGMVQQIVGVRRDAIYATMLLPERGIAVGRQELPELPSSRRAMIFTPTSTVATPFMEMVESRVDAGMAIEGELTFTVHVREDGGGRP